MCVCVCVQAQVDDMETLVCINMYSCVGVCLYWLRACTFCRFVPVNILLTNRKEKCNEVM